MPRATNTLNSVCKSQENIFSRLVNPKMAEENLDEYYDFDLPNALIVTNVDSAVFDKPENKVRFEAVFRAYEDSASFQYFKCFRRARVNFSTSEVAARARIHLNETDIDGQRVKCYFVQPTDPPKTGSSIYLQPPPLEKQFLISPPASPPVGWEQNLEAHPSINYDIISAIAQLAPGQAHELHPQSDTQPGIIVHVCEEEDQSGPSGPKQKIMQTKRPERRS